MKHYGELTNDEQTAILAERYSQRAAVYDELWSPVIRPAGERLIGHLSVGEARTVVDVGTGAGALLPAIRLAAPMATIVGVDRSSGMLRLAREKHSGPLALMDVQRLALPANRFDAAIVAFVLFHVPDPERCLSEVNRVLKPGAAVGTITWGAERVPPAAAIWDEELTAAGAYILELPATDNRASCDTAEKMTALFERTGFGTPRVWSESLQHRWRPEVYFDYQMRSASRLRLQSLDERDRDACLRRIRKRLSSSGDEQYDYSGEVFMAVAHKRGADRRSGG
ncbi:MAG: class I SAM-dependent methyltransferase [Candidatus Dormibacteraeota bacterium]|nr:class I SAM-dependent methyltransferase [Candidatus Dormibacteraeota bacterium]